MEDTRLPKCVMFGEMVGGRGLCGGPGKRVDGVFPGRPQSFRHQRRPVGVMFGEMVGGPGLCEGPGKRMDGVFPGRPQSFRHQRRPVGD